MKKVYEKPEIVFESFSLSTNIGAGCEVTDPEDERLDYEGLGYAFAVGSCSFPIIDAGGDGEHNGICYNVPTSGVNLFTSG